MEVLLQESLRVDNPHEVLAPRGSPELNRPDESSASTFPQSGSEEKVG